MTTIVTRSGKGSPLTHTEVDTNFTNLNTAKLETAAIPLGTLQAPSVSFLNDSDTGIFCPQGGNSLAIATGGQYAITCTSTQAVGIQTANPNAALHVAGNARVGADDVTDAVLEIGAGASGNRTSYIDIVGDTTYTDYGLRVIRNNTGANATSELKHRGTGALNFTTEEAAPIVFYTTNSPALTITSGGLVGIGSSSPSANLEVKTTSDVGIALTNSSSVTSGNRGSISMLNSANSSVGTIRFAAVTDNVGTEIQFYTRPAAGSLTQSMTLDSSGRLGIGNTTGLGGTLGVSGHISLSGNGTGARYLALLGETSTYAGSYVLQAGGGSASYGGAITMYGNSHATYPGSVYIGTSASSGGSIIFGTENAVAPANEKARLTSDGKFLVGTSTARALGIYGEQHPLQLEANESGNWPAINITWNRSSDGFGPRFNFGRSRSASNGGVTVVQNGDSLGSFHFYGADGTDLLSEAASIGCAVDGTATINAGSFVASRRYKIATVGTTDFTAIGASANTVGVIFTATGVGAGTGTATSEPYANSMPGRLVFSTTADGASSPTERLRIQSDGILIKYGDTTSARIQPQTDNAGFLGEATKRWEAVYAVNGTIQTSDVREKTDIVDSPLGAEFIRSLRPVAYRWKVGGYTSTYDDKGNETITPNPGVRAHYGFIAQEVKQAIGETDFGGWLQEDLSDPDSQQSLRLHEFISPIVKALQEALDEIDNLKTEVAALKTA